MKEVLRFTVNTPTQVALRFEQGKKVEGRYGDQIMYTLMDNRVMYVPPAVEGRIQELAIPAGELFEITKQEVKSGAKKWIEWKVRRLPEQPQLVMEGEPNPPAHEAPEVKTNGGAANGSPNSNGHANGLSVPAPLPDPIAGTGVRLMDVALTAAAEIAQRVESRAASNRFPLRFSSEDIRAIGLTLFIQAARDLGVRWQQ